MTTIKEIKMGDLLTFKASDNNYKVLLCTSVYKERSPHYYTFAALTYSGEEKPTLPDAIDSKFFGVGNTHNEIFKYSDAALVKIWSIHPEIKNYLLGSYGFTIWRKDFMKFQEHFEFIGNLQILEHIDKNGCGSVNASSWDFLKNFFNEELEAILRYRGQKMYKVKSIIKDNSI